MVRKHNSTLYLKSLYKTINKLSINFSSGKPISLDLETQANYPSADIFISISDCMLHSCKTENHVTLSQTHASHVCTPGMLRLKIPVTSEYKP